jgi:hypothetical protein
MGKFAAGSIVVLLAALAAAGMYISQLRTENLALRGQLAATEKKAAPLAKSAPAGAPAARPPAPRAAEPAQPRLLTEEQRRMMSASLSAEKGDVWFVSNRGDEESVAYQRAIQDVFEQNGWQVKSSEPSTFNLRPGIFFLMADEDPPSYVLTALGAFEAADITVSAGRGYRAFNEQKKKENPNWRGFEMPGEQTYVIAIGPAPRGEPTAKPAE